ncbi:MULTISPECIES: GntR family transcriptional regulator [unclassified Streptomyces]|uniref:GntR family transcriptional regulator n=1 Tax=unclassified Streptomyces TaxID=2593676 RepID=UPI001FD60FB3|nr:MULTISPECIES: GntR family transcriptional regulator [unclassified Streptomyces]MCZ4098729.1 GntR family transcriptional regulator [Streptomyces sp. H39-C1]
MSDALAPYGQLRPGSLPSRTEAVLDAVKHGILVGELKPGQPLVETELAALLGVSKTPVREALKTLAGTGLVIMSPYRGAWVREVDEALARSVYDMRLLLEPVAAARTVATPRRSWDAAEAALDRADRAVDTAERSLANRDFHRTLYADCGNPLLVGSLDGLRDQTALVSSAAWAVHPSWEMEAREHREILRAAQSGRPDLVGDLLRGHIGAFMARNFPEKSTD